MNTTVRSFTVVVALALVLSSSNLGAQQESGFKTSRYWMNLGVGIGSPGLSVGGTFSYDLGGTMLSIRAAGSTETALFGNSPLISVGDLAILYGVVSKGRFGTAAVSIGPGYATGTKRGKFLRTTGGWFSTVEYESVDVATLGVAGEVQLYVIPISTLGLGVTAFANLNPKQSFGGLLFNLQFGGTD